MFKSNKTLGIVFVALAVVTALVFLTDTGRKERTFRKELVTIDTAKVSEIIIYPKSQKGKEVRLVKENDVWKVVLDNEKKAPVAKNKVKGIFDQLLSVKPNRLVAREKEKWTAYEVDSTATRVIVMEDGKKTLDLVIGRFNFKQPRSMSTYVRLFNDTDVYEVDGFLSMSFNRSVNDFRNNVVISDNYKKWNKLIFDYPADSSFQMTKVKNRWTAGVEILDSAKTEQYLRKIAHVNNSKFDDSINPEKLGKPTYKLTIEGENGKNITVSAYVDSSKSIIASSENPGTYFNDKKLVEKIFIGLGSLR